MDVTFNNVLEGARQYFQGLPSPVASSVENSHFNPEINAIPSSASGPSTNNPAYNVSYSNKAAAYSNTASSHSSVSSASSQITHSSSANVNNLHYWPPQTSTGDKSFTQNNQFLSVQSAPQSYENIYSPHYNGNFSNTSATQRNMYLSQNHPQHQSTLHSPPPQLQKPQQKQQLQLQQVAQQKQQPQKQPDAFSQQFPNLQSVPRSKGHNLPPIATISNRHGLRHSISGMPVSQGMDQSLGGSATLPQRQEFMIQSESKQSKSENSIRFCDASSAKTLPLSQYGHKFPQKQSSNTVTSPHALKNNAINTVPTSSVLTDISPSYPNYSVPSQTNLPQVTLNISQAQKLPQDLHNLPQQYNYLPQKKQIHRQQHQETVHQQSLPTVQHQHLLQQQHYQQAQKLIQRQQQQKQEQQHQSLHNITQQQLPPEHQQHQLQQPQSHRLLVQKPAQQLRQVDQEPQHQQQQQLTVQELHQHQQMVQDQQQQQQLTQERQRQYAHEQRQLIKEQQQQLQRQIVPEQQQQQHQHHALADQKQQMLHEQQQRQIMAERQQQQQILSERQQQQQQQQMMNERQQQQLMTERQQQQQQMIERHQQHLHQQQPQQQQQHHQQQQQQIITERQQQRQQQIINGRQQQQQQQPPQQHMINERQQQQQQIIAEQQRQIIQDQSQQQQHPLVREQKIVHEQQQRQMVQEQQQQRQLVQEQQQRQLAQGQQQRQLAQEQQRLLAQEQQQRQLAQDQQQRQLAQDQQQQQLAQDQQQRQLAQDQQQRQLAQDQQQRQLAQDQQQRQTVQEQQQRHMAQEQQLRQMSQEQQQQRLITQEKQAPLFQDKQHLGQQRMEQSEKAQEQLQHQHLQQQQHQQQHSQLHLSKQLQQSSQLLQFQQLQNHMQRQQLRQQQSQLHLQTQSQSQQQQTVHSNQIKQQQNQRLQHQLPNMSQQQTQLQTLSTQQEISIIHQSQHSIHHISQTTRTYSHIQNMAHIQQTRQPDHQQDTNSFPTSIPMANSVNAANLPHQLKQEPQDVYGRSRLTESQQVNEVLPEAGSSNVPSVMQRVSNTSSINAVASKVQNQSSKHGLSVGIGNLKGKRESPLDLSVKTVRQSADSTAADESDCGFSGPSISPCDVPSVSGNVQPLASEPIGDVQNVLQTPPALSVPSFDKANAQSNCVRGIPTPKVDYRTGSLNSRPIPTSGYSAENQRLTMLKPGAQQQALNYFQTPIPSLPHVNNLRKSSHPQFSTEISSNSSLYKQPVSNKPYHSSPGAQCPDNTNTPQVNRKADFMNVTNLKNDNTSVGLKRLYEGRHSLPAKIPRIDSWSATIDQQIEQKFSSYTKLHKQDQNKQIQESRPFSSETSRDSHYVHNFQTSFPNNIPSQREEKGVFGLPNGIAGDTKQSLPQLHLNDDQHTIRKLLTASKSDPPPDNISNNGTNMLSILRSSLEIKEARISQLQNQLQHNAQLQQSTAHVGSRSSNTQVASKIFPQSESLGQVSRHKLHLPRAVDSVLLELDASGEPPFMGQQEGQLNHKQMQKQLQMSQSQQSSSTDSTLNSSGSRTGDYDKFAAYLAARIRTKAELKQVSPDIEQLTALTPSSSLLSPLENAAVELSPVEMMNIPVGEAMISVGSPPKLTREHGMLSLPRRKLSNTSEDCPMTGAIAVLSPPVPALHNTLGLRSSSETSVFDFPDSDSEGEMPVLERQTLYEMRRDRKLLSKVPNRSGASDFEGISIREDIANNITDTKDESDIFIQGPASPNDAFWATACDQFLEQLQAGSGTTQKRGRKKKVVEVSSVVTEDTCEKVAPKEQKNDITELIEIKETKGDLNRVKNLEHSKVCSQIDSDVNSSSLKRTQTAEECIIADVTEIKKEKNSDIESDSVSRGELLKVSRKILKEENKMSKTQHDSFEDEGNDSKNVERKMKKSISNEEKKEKVCKESSPDLPVMRRRRRKKRKLINRQISVRNVRESMEGQSEKRTFRNGSIKSTQEIFFRGRGRGRGKRKFKSTLNERKFVRKLKSYKEDSEEDLPLTKQLSIARNKVEQRDDEEISLAEIKARLKRGRPRKRAAETIISRVNDVELSSSSSESGDSSSDGVPQESVAARVHRRKGCSTGRSGMRLRPRNTSLVPRGRKKGSRSLDNSKKNASSTSLSEAKQFGDGSDFHPGWEEEVYRFKQSLRMPAQLINIPKPPGARHLSVSLPDLDQSANSLLESTSIRKGSGQHRLSHSDLNSHSSSQLLNGSVPNKTDGGTESENKNSAPSLSRNHTKRNDDGSINSFSQVHDKNVDRKMVVKKKFGKSSFILRSTSSDNELSLSEVSRTREGGTKVKKADLARGKTDACVVKKESGSDGTSKDGSKKKVGVSNILYSNNKLGNDNLTYKSRTRTQTRLMQQKPTILAVFGEERPASAPPSCEEPPTQLSDNKISVKVKTMHNTVGVMTRGRAGLRTAAMLRSNKAVMKSKRHLLHSNKNRNMNMILRTVSRKKISADGVSVFSSEPVVMLPQMLQGNRVNSTKTLTGTTTIRKRIKLRNVRRKFRSGFDYIRKKKKQQKKDPEVEPLKERKKTCISRPSSESVQDIQAEIRGWVINKGLGETLLHRAARLGYTDVAAYCLEKMDSAPSPQDNAGYTPLHEACARGHLDIARLLLMYGADVSASALGGVRPLHEAAENGYTELVRLLLSYGADPLLATYSGVAPLALATDEGSRWLLQHHLADVQGLSATSWTFHGAASFLDPVASGYDPLQDAPCASPEAVKEEEIDIEISDVSLPVLYQLRGESLKERWVLFQDLALLLRIKSRDVLLRQICPGPGTDFKSVMRELKMADFLQQAHCCHVLGGGEKVNIRASKVALVKYNDRVRELLGVEKVTLSTR